MASHRKSRASLSPDLASQSLLQPSSLRKLLSSHSSIYNALNNPELDTPENNNMQYSSTMQDLQPSARASQSQLPDLQFSINSSWQSINIPEDYGHAALSGLGVELKRPTSSILLSISDDIGDTGGEKLEKCESTVMIPFPKKVMVFETDEEDEEDESANNIVSLRKRSYQSLKIIDSTPNSFVMPKMSFSDNNFIPREYDSLKQPKSKKKIGSTGGNRKFRKNRNNQNNKYIFNISILCSSLYHHETIQLINSLQDEYLTHQLSDFNVDEILSLQDCSKIRRSDLIFIINDGSFNFVTQILDVFKNMGEEMIPKLSVINLITVNYFINLFELINILKPFQIWKTSSLKTPQFNDKIREFIDFEYKGVTESEFDKRIELSLIESNFSIKKKPDYKQIEKSFKNELISSSSSIDNVDPLLITSSKYQYLDSFSSLISCFQGKICNIESDKFWMLCSFTFGIGIGVGLTLSSSSSNLLQNHSDQRHNIINNSRGIKYPNINNNILKNSAISEVLSIIINKFSNNLNIVVNELTNTTTFGEFSDIAKFSASYLYSLNLILLDNFRGGLEKVFGIFMYINY